MKFRTGFISNSSSSSFIIDKKHLTAMQVALIKNHSAEGDKFGIECSSDEWSIRESETHIEGYTYMDNFAMRSFLDRIGVDMSKVEWDGENYGEMDWEDD